MMNERGDELAAALTADLAKTRDEGCVGNRRGAARGSTCHGFTPRTMAQQPRIPTTSMVRTVTVSVSHSLRTIDRYITEITVVHRDIDESLAHVQEWMKPIQRPSPGIAMPCYSEVRQEPRGCVLVISPFNYPVSLALSPMVSALAAGNVVVIKPSEQVSRCWFGQGRRDESCCLLCGVSDCETPSSDFGVWPGAPHHRLLSLR